MALSTTQYGYIIDPMVPFTDEKGNTIKDGFVRVFVAGSSTPVITYRNFDGATNQDRIELDNSGRTKTSVIGSKGLTYKVCVYDAFHSQDSPILTVDKVSAIGANITAGAGATVVTGLDGLTTKPDGFVDASVIGTDGYVALDHTLVTDDLNTEAKVTAVENDRYIPLLNDDVNDPDSKMTLGRLWQWVFGKISNIATSITAFRSGDYIPVDGPSGTAKIPAEIFKPVESLKIVSNEEYVYAITDLNDTFLFGIKNDGSVEWVKGLPEHLQKILDNVANGLIQKVDKEVGKSLINSDVAGKFSIVSDNEYIFAITDVTSAVLFGVTIDGRIVAPIFAEGKLVSPEFADAMTSFYDPEYAYVFVGADNSVLFGIRKDGRIVADTIFDEVDKKIKGIDAVNAEYVNNAVESERTRAETAEQGLQHAIDSINPVIVEGGSNTPDDIFLTEENGAITLKGTSNLLYGLNIKFVPQGTSLSGALTDRNTIYVLRFAYNLNGIVEVPENCVLLFEGGSVYNGTLKGSGTKIIYRGAFLASNAVISGTWNVRRISSDMLVDKTSENSLLKLIPFMSDSVFNEFVVESGNFILAARTESDRLIDVCSNTLVRIDGNVTMKPNGYTHYNMIFAENKNNIEITGAGLVSGDADEHDYTTAQSTHEWCMCIELRNCKKVSIHDIVLKNAPGDGIELAGENIEIKNVKIQHCGRQGVSVLSAENVIIENLIVDDIYRTAPKAAIDIEPYNSEIAKNIFVRNVNISNCAGIQVLYCDGVSIENVDSENCDILFIGTDAKNVSINRVKYRGDSIVSSNFFKFDSDCAGISVDDFDVDSDEAATFNVDNVFTGLKMNLGSNITVSGNPDKGTIKEDRGKYIFFNGTSWVNMDGTSL